MFSGSATVPTFFPSIEKMDMSGKEPAGEKPVVGLGLAARSATGFFPAGDFAIFLEIAMVLKLLGHYLEKCAAAARHRTTHDNLARLFINNEHLQIRHCHAVSAQSTGHFHALGDPAAGTPA